eukprot:scaffold2482_cov196-Alexandrium_tamarense.AAC.14
MLMSWRLLRVVKSFCGVDERFVRDHNEPSDELADDSRTRQALGLQSAVRGPAPFRPFAALHTSQRSAATTQTHNVGVGVSLFLLDIQSGCIGSIQIVSSSV